MSYWDGRLEWTDILVNELKANGCSIDIFEGPNASMYSEDVLIEA